MAQIKISSPIAKQEVFDLHAEGIEYHLSELIENIYLAGDYTGDDLFTQPFVRQRSHVLTTIN